MKRNFILLLLVQLAFAATAQTASGPVRAQEVIAECHRLHSDGEHATALTLVESIDTRTLDEKTTQEVALLRALITFENDHRKGKELLKQYMERYPNSSQMGVLECRIAQSLYLDGDYEGACTLFEKSNMKRLAKPERDRATFYHALSLLECGHDGNAADMLMRLKESSKEYAADATFHMAVHDYDNGRLDEAHRAFKSIQMNDKYYLDIPYYLAGISLKKGDAESARNIAVRFIGDHGSKPQGTRMKQILGAAEFAMGNCDKAAAALEEYIAGTANPQRIALYQFAVCRYMQGDLDSAKELFGNCTSTDDEIAQNSFLHKGMIALKQNDTNGARLAFELASQMNHNDALREEALYNYAMCLHRANHSAFGEGVRTFEKFLNEYPRSKHAKTISGQLVDVYMNTKNYSVALESIEKIQNPQSDILKAKQNILYRLGVQEFINGNYRMSIDYMNRSLKLGEYDSRTKANALFWKGEALYKTGEYANAEKMYRQAAAIGGDNNSKAVYNIGYIQFRNKDYDNARESFMKFVGNARGENPETVADAYSRIGDCYYYQRRFATAKQYYDKATDTDSKSADYALFRTAMTQGMEKAHNAKITTLKQLIKEYPKSTYAEQAYYELGRTYIEMNRHKDAIVIYDELAKRYPASQLTRRAATEKAMIYNNNGEYSKAISAYKEIIAQYPHSEEAQLALQDLRNIYIEQGNVKAYAEYVENTKGLQAVDSNGLDTLAYTAAERFYSKRDLARAKIKFNEYLDEFKNGAFRLNSHYYLGLIQYQEKDYDAALENLEAVIAYPDNKFREEALIRAGEIYFNTGQYQRVITTFKELVDVTLDEGRRNTAHINIIRAAKKIDNHAEVINSAGQLAGNSNVEPDRQREAMLNRAKAYMAQGNNETAMDDLEPLAEDTRTREGAESKYLIAEIMFDDGQYEECEEEIFDYIEVSTPHAYWLARSFVLLADVYMNQGKKMEAREYLVSLQNNYEADDEIKEMIQERLTRLEDSNNEQQ